MTAEITVPVIAIDGPGGAGKGTVCAEVAHQLGWHLLDSGSLYRLTGLAARRQGIDFTDAEQLAACASSLDVRFGTGDEKGNIYLSKQEVSNDIRTEMAGSDASVVAAIPAVRDALTQRQRDFARAPGLVADGRDMGSVVFTDSRLKIFLTATAEERAQRRYKQLKDKGINVNFPALLRDLEERDRRDTEREVAPLRPCEDARILDTTKMTIEEVVSQVLVWAAEIFPDA